METSVHEIEDKIKRILKDVAESSDKIKEYIDDIYAFSDINLYNSEYMDDEQIYFDYVDWAKLDY